MPKHSEAVRFLSKIKTWKRKRCGLVWKLCNPKNLPFVRPVNDTLRTKVSPVCVRPVSRNQDNSRRRASNPGFPAQTRTSSATRNEKSSLPPGEGSLSRRGRGGAKTGSCACAVALMPSAKPGTEGPHARTHARSSPSLPYWRCCRSCGVYQRHRTPGRDATGVSVIWRDLRSPELFLWEICPPSITTMP